MGCVSYSVNDSTEFRDLDCMVRKRLANETAHFLTAELISIIEYVYGTSTVFGGKKHCDFVWRSAPYAETTVIIPLDVPSLVLCRLKNEQFRFVEKDYASDAWNKDIARQVALRMLFARKEAAPQLIIDGTTEQVNPVPGVNIGTAAIRNYQQDIVCAVVPVQLRCNGRVVDSFALLDSGSEVTLMDSSVAERLQATGSKRQLRIRTVNGEQVVQVRELTCELSSRDGMFNFCLDRAVAVPRLDMGARVLHLRAVKAEWQHLKDLPFPSVTSGRVEVLIGMDVPLAHRHYDMRCDSRQRNAPVGLLTPFGWTIVGHIPNASFCSALPNQTTWIGRHACIRHAEPLKILLEQFLNADPLTVQATNAKVTVEERIALKTMEDSLRFNGTRYEIGYFFQIPAAEVALRSQRQSVDGQYFST
uniref:Peptidase A2 domain-containing protein n=1 Tax=Trichuris muris TaxID=70415 RepID=A0A5S6Q4K1_TRIMR